MKTSIVFAILLLLAGVCTQAQAQTTASPRDSAAVLVGKWSGTYDGSDSGNFELVINQAADGTLSGQIIMLAPDGNRYPIDLKTVTYKNRQLNAGYTDPSGNGEVTFGGMYDSPALKGTWQLNGGQGAGTFQLTRADR